ncbi:NAD-dependent succinate-semialdehyde dehydrogenase [Suttonella sp. R2A3]|uniref:NAD-dependent succinate-semialdehyde dehydrogenase n=1 Tax=Suttonella sp. R2A3 TaxID=2908648 RepID=UPI001F3CD1A7|nr:NAD-dependent succinate-semialdehyde dehydrogenase [Suttonella sp. R2A3]UJF24250.1 NAD-dependent succinate-semialdehyde dehydrogenase [Suttonella sp. R2A3]
MLHLSDKSLLKSKCLIEDGWYGATDQAEIAVTNPFNGDVLSHVPQLSAEQITSVIQFASKTQKSWARRTAEDRAQLMHCWADLIDEHTQDLAAIMTAEQGKPLKESLGEIRYANSFIRWFAEEGKRVYGDTIPAKSPDLRYVVIKQPVGVCAAITPWNFPAAMITRKVAPAMAVGCTSIVKPATETPLTALAIGELALRAGIPAGVLQIVTGKSSEIGGVLTSSVEVQKLSFTGSTEVGRTLMAQCAPTLKKLSMELGGNAPFIVFADADIDAAVDGLIASKYRNAGQTCICANRIYIEQSIAEACIAKLSDKVRALRVGDGAQEQTDIGPLINKDALDKNKALVADALEKGAQCVLGGHPHEASALSFEPTILTGITQEMRIAHEEIFGPIAVINTFTSEEAVIAAANDTEFGLAAYFYTNDAARSWRVMERLDYGMVGHNTGLISTEVAPFGGVKQSGFGREGSKYGIEEYLNIKYWCTSV